MIAVALKGLAGRKVRALLTAFAVVIGVSMVSGTFILTDTMQKTFDGLFAASYDRTDAVIEGRQIVEKSTSGAATVPQSLLADVRKLPGVAAASGTVSPADTNSADIIGRDGKPVGRQSLGTSIDRANARLSPLRLKTGGWPSGPGQVVLDAGTAKGEHYRVGDTVRVKTAGKTAAYRMTGTASFGDVDSVGFGSIAVWDLPTAQALLGRQGRFDSISIASKEGTSAAALVQAVKPLVPATLEVKDSARKAAEDSAEADKALSFIRYFLLGFGGIALFVGTFVIFNTLSITVAQRTREFATLRTLGASRKQVLRSVRLEGLAIGLIASVLGLFLGFGIAKGMLVLFSAMGVDLPKADTVFAARTAVVSILLGTGITLLATVLPARRATRVPPIAAVREGSALPVSRFGARLGPWVVRPLVRLVGWPLRRTGGVAADLAGANAARNPGRTASTAAALTIGLTLVTLVAVLGAGLNTSITSAIDDQLRAGYVLDGNGQVPFNAAEGDALAAVPGVTAASQVRADKALVRGEEIDVTGVDPATIGRFYRFAWTQGSDRTLAALGSDGALVTKRYAEASRLQLGGRLAIQTPSGEKRSLVVRGIYDPPQVRALLNNISISRATFDAAFPNPRNSFTFLDAKPGAGAALKAAAKGSGEATLHPGAAYAKDATKDAAKFLAMLYVLLGFSIVVSLFGMVNTLVLSVFERTRELGMLRAIGMSRRQARRMIRHESVITALIGAALGLGLGVLLAALATQALSQYDVTLALPVPTLGAFTLVAVLAGVAAAILPARRASRLNVLDALHYE
jgi:putative ABC transport system permease protein